jgi:uncharacterized protein with HEPN domain
MKCEMLSLMAISIVDLEIVWRTIHQDLPELHEQVHLLLKVS